MLKTDFDLLLGLDDGTVASWGLGTADVYQVLSEALSRGVIADHQVADLARIAEAGREAEVQDDLDIDSILAVDVAAEMTALAAENPLSGQTVAQMQADRAAVEADMPVQQQLQLEVSPGARPDVEFITIQIPVVRSSGVKLSASRNQSFSLTSADDDVRRAYGQMYDGLRYAFTELNGGGLVTQWSDVYRFIGQQIMKASMAQLSVEEPVLD